MTPRGVLLIRNIEKCEQAFLRGCPSASDTIEPEIGDLLERVSNALPHAEHRPSAIEMIEQHVKETLLKILEMVYRARGAEQERRDLERRRHYWLYN